MKYPLPYYAVIFSSQKSKLLEDDYNTVAQRMVELATKQEGYLGHESYRNEEGKGVTISYWKTLENIANWKKNEEHLEAQERGVKKWYQQYQVRIAKVEREYDFNTTE